MRYQVVWTEPAERQLKKLDRFVAKQIYQKVGLLSENPHRFVRRLTKLPFYRLRVGQYRVILDIQSGVLRVLVLEVGHRRSVYNR